jgi:capsular exopolysaccharide synthesis family protein
VSIGELVLAVRRHALLFAACVACSVAVGVYAAVSATPSYTAHIQFLVSATATNEDTLLQDNQLVQERLPSYVPLVNSPLVVVPVVERLRLREDPGTVAGRISTSNPLGTALLDVSVRAGTADGARRLALGVEQAFEPAVAELEAPPGGRSPIRITTVRAPELPAAPDRTGAARWIGLSLLLGLGLGAAAAVARDLVDTSVRDAEELRADLGVRPLATVPLDSPLPGRAVEDGSRSPQAEGFRRLRTTVEALRSVEGLRSVLVTGPRAEDAAPVVAVELAVAFGLAGVRVLLIGSDLRDDALPGLLGIDGTAGLTDVLVGEATPAQVVRSWTGGPIDVLPAGLPPANPSELLSSVALEPLLRDLEADYDLLLLTAPPVLDFTDATVLATVVNAALLTVRLGRTPRDAVRQAVRSLRDVGAHVLGAVALASRDRRPLRTTAQSRRTPRDPSSGPSVPGRPADHAAETPRLPTW